MKSIEHRAWRKEERVEVESVAVKLERRLNDALEDEVEVVLNEYEDGRITVDEMGRNIALINHVRRGAVKLCANKIKEEDGDR